MGGVGGCGSRPHFPDVLPVEREPGRPEFYLARLREDRRLRAELDYCAPRGIPHSDFLNWEQDDQDKALAWQVDEADKCPGCGTRSYEADDYEVGKITCRVCKDISIRGGELMGRTPPKFPGRHLVLRRRDGKQT